MLNPSLSQTSSSARLLIPQSEHILNVILQMYHAQSAADWGERWDGFGKKWGLVLGKVRDITRGGSLLTFT